MIEFSDPEVQSALIAAAVTLFVLVLQAFTKPLWERHFHRFKLESEYKNDQRKKVRGAISKHKVPLLNAAEYLNHRLWNFSENAHLGWHVANSGVVARDQYYLQSFCYRFLLFFAICSKVDLDLVFLDSTESTSKDLEFLKYLRLFQQFFCDAGIFKGLNYDDSKDTDHFFGDDFRGIISKIEGSDGFISFSEFKARINEEDFQRIVGYISGVSIDRSCKRWYVLNGLHFALMSFLNDYGYDFQKTAQPKISKLAKGLPKNLLINNVERFAGRISLGKNKSVREVIKAMSEVN